ncbi:MAG: MFS transporter [SAR324 cluster bacterium]|nr:MFS transporter [SAR324 cluster bacterium]
MSRDRARFLFLNVGHAYDHLFMLLFPTVVLVLEREWNRPFAELLPYALGGFIAFGLGALPAGLLGDRWSRPHMMTVFFLGIGGASILTGMAAGPWGLAAGLTLIGLFASIYHPVGVAMVVQGVENVGLRLGVNGVAGNLGVAAAALTAGALAELIHWRAAFIVPGAVSVATGIGFFFFALGDKGAEGKSQGNKGRQRAQIDGNLVRVFVVLGLVAIFGGVIFHSTLVSLPKMFAVRLGGVTDSAFQVSLLVSMVYVMGAFSQVLVGLMLDRYPLRGILMLVAAVQIPFMVAAPQVTDWALVALTTMMVFTIFGTIPIQDTLVARYTTEDWRSTVYALKYLLGLGISPVAVGLVALIYGGTGEFTWLFAVFTALSVSIFITALLLPRGDAPQVLAETAASPAPSGGGD